METIEEKNKPRKYEKRKHPFIRLNVDNYLAGVSGNPSKNSRVRYQLLSYLNAHRNAEFKTYDDIAEALRKEYALQKPARRGTISKEVNALRGELIFGDGTYYFGKIDGTYKLHSRFSNDEHLLVELFKIKNAFRQESVHLIGKDTAVFAVNPAKIDEVKEKFSMLLSPSVCFGLMACDDCLVIMLNSNDSGIEAARELVRTFFKRKKDYEKHIQRKKMLEEAHEKQDKEILKKQRKIKYGPFI